MSPMTTLRAAKKRGLTLIEVLLVLGLMALAIVAAVLYFNSTSNTQRTNDALTQIQTYSTGIKGLSSGQSNYGANANLAPVAISGGIAPRNAVNGTALVNPWGGATTLTGLGNTFRISMAGVPQESCVRLVSGGLMTTGGIFAMRAGSGSGAASNTATPAAPTAHTVTANNGQFVSTTTPTALDASTVCSTGSTNVMHFYVR